jgi:hypothetical protein
MTSRIACLAACLGVMPLAAAPAPPSQSRAAGRVYVTVADGQGQPVSGLSADDFFLSLDGAPQEVLSAGPATEPLSIVLLTDRLGLNADYRAPDLQKALARFVSVVRSDGLASRRARTRFGGGGGYLVRFDAAAPMLDRALTRLNVVSRDAPFIDALGDACSMMRSAPTERRAIFIVFAAYRADQGNPRPDLTGEQCRHSGASVWALEARSPDGRNYSNPAREMVVDEVSRASGGMHELVATAGQLEGLSGVFGTLLSSQYVVAFGPGGGSSTSRLTVGVKRAGVVVLAPSWVAR